MLSIYCCLSRVSWEGHQRFHKGVVKPTFPFRIYQQPCNSGGLKYGQSACYSTSPGCFCSVTLHANGAPTPCQSNIVRPADASGMRRDLVMPFRTLSAKAVCQESENQTVDLPDLKKTQHCVLLEVWEVWEVWRYPPVKPKPAGGQPCFFSYRCMEGCISWLCLGLSG